MADVRRLEMQTLDTVTENTWLNVSQGKDGDGECGDAAVHNNKSKCCVCTMCSKSFDSKAALRMHLVRVHRKCQVAGNLRYF